MLPHYVVALNILVSNGTCNWLHDRILYAVEAKPLLFFYSCIQTARYTVGIKRNFLSIFCMLLPMRMDNCHFIITLS